MSVVPNWLSDHSTGPAVREGWGDYRNRIMRWDEETGETSIEPHLGPNLRAQHIDRDQTVGRLQMPERPAVAGLQALRQRADAMDRADRLAERDGAIGAYQRPD